MTGAPTGTTLALSPTSTTGNTSTLSIAVGSGATPGSYSLTITATGASLPTTLLTIPVTIMTVSSGGNVQNGGSTSAWTSAPAVGNSFAFSLGAHGAVAYVMQSATNSFTTNVVYGSLAELSSQGRTTCGATPLIGKTVTGSVTGFQTATDYVSVSMGTQFATSPPSQAIPTFQIAGVLDGLRDLIGTRCTFSNGFVLNRVFIKRGLNPPNLGSVGVVDSTGADASHRTREHLP